MNRYAPSNLPSPPDITASEWSEFDEREILEHDAATDTFWTRIEHPESAYLEIASAVATITGTPPESLPPIYSEVGGERLEELSSLPFKEAVTGKIVVSMTYAEHEINVYYDGVVSVEPPR